jgi:hypothetical protein
MATDAAIDNSNTTEEVRAVSIISLDLELGGKELLIRQDGRSKDGIFGGSGIWQRIMGQDEICGQLPRLGGLGLDSRNTMARENEGSMNFYLGAHRRTRCRPRLTRPRNVSESCHGWGAFFPGQQRGLSSCCCSLLPVIAALFHGRRGWLEWEHGTMASRRRQRK